MRIVHLAAGAAGMYCGSCMHDNRLVATLRAQGRDVLLVPMYTPIRTDETDVSTPHVYYGGINVYLQQSLGLFRHTPWLVDRVFDSRPLLNMVSRFAGSTRPQALGDLTLSVLRGEHGRQRKELAKLVAGLRRLKPDLVHLPNLMFTGIVDRLKEALRVPVLCTLAGEDIFLDALPQPPRAEVFALIREHAQDVDGFVAPTAYYARHATQHYSLPADRVHIVSMGIHTQDVAVAAPPKRPFTIGYLARVCPAKGLAELVRAYVALRRAGRDCRLRAAGYLGSADRPYLDAIHAEVRAAGLTGSGFEYVGEVTRQQKLEFLQSLHAFSVPATYAESKGFYVLEALAAGVPVVQPQHGAFPELVEATGGGLLTVPGESADLSDALGRLMDDEELRRRLAAAGRVAVGQRYAIDALAARTWELYESTVARSG